MNKKVLIMGGNGFIGSNIANYLFDRGYEVDIYDLFAKDNGYKNYVGNILTDDHLEEIIANYDNIIYLITSVSPKKSMEFPEESYTQDVPMLIRVLDICKKYGENKKVIFSSSGGTVYGEGKGKRLSEDSVVEQPINHYAICKLACEKILLLYNKLYKMNNVILRIANPYGKGQNPASGVGVITTFADRIIKGEKITLYGDGNTIRDFIDIDSVSEAFYRALEWKNEENIPAVFNVGSGIPMSLTQIIQIISNVLKIQPQIEFLPEREFDVKENVLDMSKSMKHLGLNTSNNHQEKIEEYILQMKKNHDNNLRR